MSAELQMSGGFTPREAAASAFTDVQTMGRGRVIGQPTAATNAARAAAFRVAQRRIAAAQGSARLLASEPSDADLDRMATVVQAELDRLDDTV